MSKWVVMSLAVFLPCIVQAQKMTPAQIEAMKAEEAECRKIEGLPPATAEATVQKVKLKGKTLQDRTVPLGLVVCLVEKALTAYQQSPEVNAQGQDVLPHILTADFDFKTVVDLKGTAGIGFYIFKIGASYDKQTTNDVDFQFTPPPKAVGFVESKPAESFQEELLNTIKSAAAAVKQEQMKPVPADVKDPLVFKQLSVTLSYGVTKDVNGGITLPINVITLTAQLDRSKNAVQSVKLVFAPPPKPGEKTQGD
jgi:hypothetical protein